MVRGVPTGLVELRVGAQVCRLVATGAALGRPQGHDESKSFTFLLTEQAVNWALIPPQAMALQIDRLSSLSRLPAVRIGVIPYGTRLTRGPMNTFTMYEDRLVTMESFTGRIAFRDPRDVLQYRHIFAMFEDMALFDDEARTELRDWADRYRGPSRDL
ncbi:Scr1 family TA system antitoxin-like transcriptional regulator [Kitasatospora sp. NPDC127059]|uniref:Scr1 family TA system antitoxin-like transcriptional regulator n=1 Tax=unclassified Kitasatospora TaxID=2633591 RepID=UPI00365EC62A